MASGRKKRFTKSEWSWIFYDWANSIYATNIMAAIFPTIFVSIAGEAGDIWWGYGTSIATFTVALLAPVLGAVADFKGMKKKLFTVFMLLGVVFTFLIAMVIGEAVNFPIQRSLVFRSKGNIWYQALWYLLAFIVITCIVNSINCIWVAVAAKFVPDWVYNIGTTVLNGGVSMVIFFFVNKIIFPEGEAKA